MTWSSYEQDGAAMLMTQAGETMNIFLEDYHWKFTYKCHECGTVGHKRLSCDECKVLRPAGVLLASGGSNNDDL